MKKYWKLSLVVLLAAVGIGSFYIQEAISKSRYPEFTLEKEKEEGDSLEKKMTLMGSYEETNPLTEQDNFYELVKITNSGSQYKSSLSFIQQQESKWFSYPDYDRLQRKHRDFMRGVVADGGVFENEKWLVSVQPFNMPEQWNTFSFKVADKKKGKQMEFQADVPNKSNSWIDIHDVQRVGNEVKVLAEIMDEKEELVLYTFSIQSQKLIRQKPFKFKNANKNVHSNWGFSDKQYRTGPENKAMFEVEYYKEIKREEDEWHETIVSKELFIIDLETETAKSVKLNTVSDEVVYFGTDSGKLFYAVYGSGKLTASQINMKTTKAELRFEIDSAEAPQTVEFKNDVLFAAYSSSIKGYDMKTGKEVYSYKIAHKPLKKGTRYQIDRIHITD